MLPIEMLVLEAHQQRQAKPEREGGRVRAGDMGGTRQLHAGDSTSG